MNDRAEQHSLAHGAITDLPTLINLAWRRRWWILGCVGVFVLVSVAIAFWLPRVYRASTVLVPATPTEGLEGGLQSALGSLGGLASLAGVDISSGGKADEVIAVLKSREFLERFIREKNLLPLFFASDWDEKTGAWKSDSEPHTLAEAHKYFTRKILSVEREKSSDLITLSIDWSDGVEAAAWTNELVRRINAEMRGRALEQANKSVGFLEQELKRTYLVGTQEAIGRLMENQINQRMLANVTSEYALRIVDRALPPDPRDPIKPRKLLIVAVGFVLGLTVGLFLVWFIPERPSTSRAETNGM
jgi:uncharacterized protein involved in exopolysaccharide biosynthesis